MKWDAQDELAHIADSIRSGELMDMENILVRIGMSMDDDDLPYLVHHLELLTEDLEPGDWPEAWECLGMAQAVHAIVQVAYQRIREKLGRAIEDADGYLDHLSDLADAASI